MKLRSVCLQVVALGIAGLGSVSYAQRGIEDITPTATPPPVSPIGPYYALVIGNNNYQSRDLTTLQTARDDAAAVAQVLKNSYGFRVNVLYDATRNDILKAFNEYRRTLPPESNLLIYYAGHGQHDRETREAYWLPVDAERESNANWISSADITADVRAIRSKHILIISDSCFSGALSRDVGATITPRERTAYMNKMLNSPSRNLMASGGDEPVADGGALRHSIFAGALLESLARESNTFTAGELFQEYIQQGVAGRSEQTPQYGPIRNSGHEYGDFVFFRQQRRLARLRPLRSFDELFPPLDSKENSTNTVLPSTEVPSKLFPLLAATRSWGTLADLLKDFHSQDYFTDFTWLNERRGEILRRSKTLYVDAHTLAAQGIYITESDLRTALLQNIQFPSLNLHLVYDRTTADLILHVMKDAFAPNDTNLLSGTDYLSFSIDVANRRSPQNLLDFGGHTFAHTTVSVKRDRILLPETDVVAIEIVKFLADTPAAAW